MNNVPPPPPPPYVPPSGPYPDGPGQPPRPRGGGTGKCFLIGCLVVPACLVAGVVGIALFVFGAIKSSDPYREGIARAKRNPQVIQALGTPIEAAYFVTGRINLRNSGGDADLQTAISGPKGDGTLSVVGTKADGVWSYTVMRVHIKGTGENVDLNNDSR